MGGVGVYLDSKKIEKMNGRPKIRTLFRYQIFCAAREQAKKCVFRHFFENFEEKIALFRLDRIPEKKSVCPLPAPRKNRY